MQQVIYCPTGLFAILHTISKISNDMCIWINGNGFTFAVYPLNMCAMFT